MAEFPIAEPAAVPSRPADDDLLGSVRARLDPVLLRFLAERRAELAAIDPSAGVLVQELERLVAAGGKRIRPALCLWAFRAAGGEEGEAIVDVGAALELLHTAALIHDDVMDHAAERRGVPSTHARFAADAPAGIDPASYGIAAAIVIGDLSLVLSERAMRTCGFSGAPHSLAMARFDRMRAEMAAGQFLDVSSSGDRERIAALKSASYTTLGPVLVGSALAGAHADVEAPLEAFARLLGAAFQLRDDIEDAEAPAGSAARVDALVDAAVGTLEGATLEPEGAAALGRLAELLRPPGGA